RPKEGRGRSASIFPIATSNAGVLLASKMAARFLFTMVCHAALSNEGSKYFRATTTRIFVRIVSRCVFVRFMSSPGWKLKGAVGISDDLEACPKIRRKLFI